MYNSNIRASHHEWEKQNLVTITKNGQSYDEMICSKCGIKGKRFTFETVEISESYSYENAHLCPKYENIIPKRVKVIVCSARGNVFSNLTPNSIHDVVEPPKGYKNDHSGVWVMGVGEPVKLLIDEFDNYEE